MRIYSHFSALIDYKLVRKERKRDRGVKQRGGIQERLIGHRNKETGGRGLALLRGGIVAQKKTG